MDEKVAYELYKKSYNSFKILKSNYGGSIDHATYTQKHLSSTNCSFQQSILSKIFSVFPFGYHGNSSLENGTP